VIPFEGRVETEEHVPGFGVVVCRGRARSSNRGRCKSCNELTTSVTIWVAAVGRADPKSEDTSLRGLEKHGQRSRYEFGNFDVVIPPLLMRHVISVARLQSGRMREEKGTNFSAVICH